MQTKQEVLQSCIIEGNVIKLPAIQLERKLYQEVAKSIELIGGKWKGNKIMGFVFNECPKELLNQISNGEKRNLKKEYQFFATPSGLADKLVQMADVNEDHLILEPSAGQGAIVKAILRDSPNSIVHCFELMDINRTFLEKIPDCVILGKNFLHDREHYMQFDRIIANPPFSKNQDIEHIIQMYLCLKPGGKLVSITGKHWQFATENKCQQFREWLNEVNAEIEEVPSGTFKESGTNIETVIITIDK